MTAPVFDRIVVVDWSARAQPATGQDSIWIASVDTDHPAERQNIELTNPPTRRSASETIERLVEPGRRMLLGVDFSLGYPSGTAAGWGLAGPAWQATWRHLGSEIVDDARNRNNRFEVATRLNAAMNAATGAGPGPFWGCPPGSASLILTATKPARRAEWPAEWRVVEQQLRDGGRQPFSAWQLLGAGAVGSQSLVGIAALERLRRNLGDRMAVWPFTTGPTLDLEADDPTGVGRADVVVAEVWPSLWPVDVPDGVVKDAAQVRSTARRLAVADATGDLRAWFDLDFRTTVGSDSETAAIVAEEEGWVLGVPAGTR